MATTIYVIDGINLELPTVNTTLEGSHRAGDLLKKKDGTESDKANNSIKMVVTAVYCYGCVTLFVSWMGLPNWEDWAEGSVPFDNSYCLNSVNVQSGIENS
jgi:hypothetical protein